MTSSSGDSAPMVDWVLNGEKVQSPAGTTILEAAKAHGAEIPHFCYHPGLSIAGNCRICLVETNRSPKPVISCSERISDGLEVQTQSEMAVDSRNGVMEFQLINHPLDCPVCDKAGECTLQDYSYDHGPDRSRFVEPKNIRHTKDLGPSIKIWGNRCIVCTRCVRFCDEISGTGELAIVERGDRSIVDVFPDLPLDNPLMGNTVDICPVGALISTDFMFQARVWNMDKTNSVCAGCARGCSVEVQSLDGFLKRLVPRHNPQVNDWWMCDHGRYDYRYAHDSARLREPQGSGEETIDPSQALDQLSALVQEAQRSGSGLGVVIDPFLTCEELYLARTLAGSVEKSQVAGWMPPAGPEQAFPAGFAISGEKAPNRVGAEAIFGPEVFAADATTLRKSLEKGDVGLLLVFAGFPHADPPEEWLQAIGASSTPRVVVTLFPGEVSAGAQLVLPSATPFDKEGTYVNEDGILQRVRSTHKPGHGPQTEFQLLQELQLRLGSRDRLLSAAGVFREMADQVEAFAGLTHQSLPTHGQRLPGFSRVAAEGEV